MYSVLIVDDDSIDREAIVRAFESLAEAFTLTEAGDGESALALLETQLFDCLILDYRLPDIDGVEFLQRLKKDADRLPLPVIMITGQGNEEIAVQSMKLGALDYLPKDSFSPENLALTVSTLLHEDTQAKLLVVNTRLEAVFANSNTLIAIIKQDKFKAINEYGAQLLGYQSLELLNQPFALLLDARTGDALSQEFDKLRKNPQKTVQPLPEPVEGRERAETDVQKPVQHSIEYPLRHRHGNTVWMYLSLTPAGADDEIALVGIDISARKQAELALQTALQRQQDAEIFARETIDALSTYLCVLDKNGVILTVNRAWREFAKHHLLSFPDDGVGSSYMTVYREIFRSGEIDEFAQGLQAVLDNHKAGFQYEYSFDCQGEQKWFVAHVTRFKSQESGCSVIAHEDITARRQLADEQRRIREARLLRRLGDNLPMGVIFQLANLAEETHFSYISAGIEDILGVTAQAIIADPNTLFQQLDAQEMPEFLAAKAESARTLQAFNKVLRHYTTDGQECWINVRFQPYYKKDGSIWADGLALDITAQKQIEDELRQARHHADTANHAKSAFLANMSHELRTPLNAVLGYAQILAKKPDLQADYLRMVNIINDSGEHLLHLLNDILDLAKIEAGRFDIVLARCSIRECLRDVENMFQMRSQQKHLNFHIDISDTLPDYAEVDKQRLQQILFNLLGNAIKFTEQGSVSMHCDYQDGYLLFRISDTGIGIAQDKLEEIFEPFQQSGDELHNAQGTGLGLAISRKLSELMGGRLNAESVIGQGSHFHVRIPAKIIAVAGHRIPEPMPCKDQHISGYTRLDGKTERLSVLIVDDIQDNREFLVHLLQELDFDIYQAESGEACLAQLSSIQPDIILMDLKMPGINGFETTQQIRASSMTMPIIAVSANVSSAIEEQVKTSGCNDYLAKPLRIDEISNCLGKYLPLRWLTDQDESAPATPFKNSSNKLSQAQREALLDLLGKGDIKRILANLKTLQESADTQLEATALLKLAKAFRLDELKTILKSSGKSY